MSRNGKKAPENGVILPNVTAESVEAKLTFERLKPYQRRAFIKDRANSGFFDRVVERLAEAGIKRTKSTVSRTWHGVFARQDPSIVAALEAEYLERPNQRPSRRVA